MRRSLAITLVLLAASGPLADVSIPEYDGPITDRAGVLDRSDVRQLESKIIAFRDQSGHEIGVLIVPTIGDQALEDYAHDVFGAWGIGRKDKDNGVLFLIAIQERKARIEVGYGLEGDLTDLESGRLVKGNSPMAQHFRKGDYAGGVNAVIDGIVQAIGGEYDPPPTENDGGNDISAFLPIGFILLFIVIAILRRRGIIDRGFGSGGFGGFGGGFRGSGRSGGGFSFGGGSSGGGGASGGW